MQLTKPIHNQAISQATGDTLDSEVINILAQAFDHNPVMGWVTNKKDYSQFVFETVLPMFKRHDMVWVTPEKDGALLCLPPHTNLDSPINIKSIVGCVVKFGVVGALRTLRIMMSMHQNRPDFPHYYLYAMGTTTRSRYMGVGALMLDHFIEMAEADGAPIYLENGNEMNLEFYRARGFAVCKEVEFDQAGAKMWLMVRPPKKTLLDRYITLEC